MRLFYVSCFVAGFATQLSAQTYDQVSNDAGYTKQAYYTLSSGASTQISNDTWDLGFSALGQMDAGIHLNESSTSTTQIPALELYLANTSDFSLALNEADLTNRIYNPETNWAEGALNVPASASNPFDLGWGLYNPATHVIEGNRVFAIKLRSGIFKKFMIESLSGNTYTLKMADLNNNNLSTATLNKANANGSPLVYYSFTTGLVNSMPTTWDLVFERYSTPIFDGTDFMPYTVLGVLSGEGVSAAKAAGINPQTVSYNSFQDSMTTDMDRIGYEWKSFSGTAWNIPSDLAYFVKTKDNHLWKIVFVDFEGGSTGITTLEKTDLGVVSAISAGSLGGKTLVYPTITESDITIALSDLSATTIDASLVNDKGEKVWQTSFYTQSKLDVRQFQLPTLATGTYRLHLASAMGSTTHSIFVVNR